MEIADRGLLFLSGFMLFTGTLGLMYIDQICEFMWKIHCIRVDNKLERMVRNYMENTGWRIVWDKSIRGWMCIGRGGFRITLKDACNYVKDHHDENDPYYWANDFMVWNYVDERDIKK